MFKNLIIFHFHNKKILLPFGVALIQIIINIIELTYPEKQKNPMLESLGGALSEMSIALIPLFNICTTKNISKKEENKKFNKKSIKHFLILIAIFSCFMATRIFLSNQMSASAQGGNKPQSKHTETNYCSIECLEMIFLCIISIIILKYKYYKHHIISFVIFFILCFLMDYIAEAFPELIQKGALFIILNILLTFLDSMNYGYQKYMMEVHYHPYWSIPLTIGITNVFIFVSMLIFCFSKGRDTIFKEKNVMFMGFYTYFENVEAGIIIGKQILNFVLSFFLYLLRTLTILHLAQDSVLINIAITKVINIVIEKHIYTLLILFAFQLIVLMIYLELIELNFWGLNKNTRRNIYFRERNDTYFGGFGRDSCFSLSSIEVFPDYLIDCRRPLDKEIYPYEKDNNKVMLEMSKSFKE